MGFQGDPGDLATASLREINGGAARSSSRRLYEGRPQRQLIFAD